MRSRYSLPLAALALTLAGTAAPAPASAEDPERSSERGVAIESVAIQGRGYGHGHGLSQYGAEGAARQGLTHRQILRFYYPGTRWGSAGGKVSVLISADRTRNVVVRARPGLKVEQVGGRTSVDLTKAKPRAKRWRIVPVAGGRSKVEFKTSQWRRLTTIKGAAEFSAGGRPIALFVTNQTRVAYRGALRATRGDTVNILPLDSYLQGVVPLEIFPSWHSAALRSQAVAARTYAAFERRERLAPHYQICDTTQCQVYGGYSAEQPTTNAAIKATAKQVLTKGGKPAFTQFSASSGGWTSAGGFSYLPAKKDPYDGWSGNPYRRWTATIAASTVEKAFPAIGDLTGVEVTARDSIGKRATSVRISGTNTSTTITGDTFRSIFGLRSTLFSVA